MTGGLLTLWHMSAYCWQKEVATTDVAMYAAAAGLLTTEDESTLVPASATATHGGTGIQPPALTCPVALPAGCLS